MLQRHVVDRDIQASRNGLRFAHSISPVKAWQHTDTQTQYYSNLEEEKLKMLGFERGKQ